MSTVTEGIAAVVSERLDDIEVDFWSIFRRSQLNGSVLVALACRPADGVAVRRPSARRGRAQAPRAAERSALGRAERRKLVA